MKTHDRLVVSNTTPILSLIKIGKLDLLPALYGKIQVVQTVFDEIEQGRHLSAYVDLSTLPWVEIKPVMPPNIQQLVKDTGFQLDAGEADTLALALRLVVLDTRPQVSVIIDEKMGRQAGKSLCLKMTGTLGVLLRAKEKGLVHEILPLIDKLQSAGVWIDGHLKNKVLRIAGELR